MADTGFGQRRFGMGAVNPANRDHGVPLPPPPGVTEDIAPFSLHLLNLFVFSSGTVIFLCI